MAMENFIFGFYIKAFRGIFKKITGLSPIEYRIKYNKIALEPTEEVV